MYLKNIYENYYFIQDIACKRKSNLSSKTWQDMSLKSGKTWIFMIRFWGIVKYMWYEWYTKNSVVGMLPSVSAFFKMKVVLRPWRWSRCRRWRGWHEQCWARCKHFHEKQIVTLLRRNFVKSFVFVYSSTKKSTKNHLPFSTVNPQKRRSNPCCSHL